MLARLRHPALYLVMSGSRAKTSTRACAAASSWPTRRWAWRARSPPPWPPPTARTSSIPRHLALDPDNHRALALGLAELYFDGQGERARERAERAVAAAPDDPGVFYNVACLHAVMGDKDQALRYLEKIPRPDAGGRAWARRDPDLASLRDDPRFVALYGSDS
jgi:hypothetical protein